ncbi:hypothetical protein EWB00_001359, partial [Schistosoma japonicum]
SPFGHTSRPAGDKHGTHRPQSHGHSDHSSLQRKRDSYQRLPRGAQSREGSAASSRRPPPHSLGESGREVPLPAYELRSAPPCPAPPE